MKTSKIIRALIIILVLTLTLFVAMPQNSASALSLDEIIENPDNITQITLPLHYSNTGDKNKALNEIRNEYKKETGIELDGNFKDAAGNKYVVLIDKDPTLSTTGLGEVDLNRMVDLPGAEKFTFQTGAYTYVVARTKVVGGQAVIDQTSLSIGVIIAGVYNNISLNVTGLKNGETPKVYLDSEFALEDEEEEGVYHIVNGMSYTIVAEEIPNYNVTIEGAIASSKVFKSNGADKVINIHYEEMTEPDLRVRTQLDLNSKLTVEFGSYLDNAYIYKQLVRGHAGVINLSTKLPIEGLNPATMFEFRAEDKTTGSTVTDLSTLEAGTYEVTVEFHGIKQYCFSSNTTFTLVVEKATANVGINNCVVGYEAVLNGGLTKDELVTITSNTLKANAVDHVYFAAGLDVLDGTLSAYVDFTHVLSHPNAMIQGEIDKQLRLITEEHDKDGDGLTVAEFYAYVEALCDLANIKGINFENERLNSIVDKLSTLSDMANIKIYIVTEGEYDITPNSYGSYLVGAIVTDLSYEVEFDAGVVVISPEVAKVDFEDNDYTGIQIREYTGSPIELKADAYDLDGKLLAGSMSYIYVGVDVYGNKYVSHNAPTNKGVYVVVAKFTNGNSSHVATHLGVGMNILLIGDLDDIPGLPDLPSQDEIIDKFEVLTRLSVLMKACGLIERFDFNLAAVLGMFDEDTVSSLFEHITEFINNNDDANAALRFVDNFFNVDTMANLEAVIKRLYPEVEERSVDVYFDTKELNVYEYNGSPISLTAHAYDANGNKLAGGVRYFYSGYQVNGEIYMSTNAPALPGVYVVNAVYFDLSNGIRQLDYGYASKAYTITSKEVTFSLNGEELNDLTVEYDGTPKTLKVVAKYSDGNLAKAGTLKVVYMDKDGNASFNAPTLPGEYTVVAVYAEKDGDAAQYFGYKIITLTITERVADVDDSDVVDCYDGNEHFKDAILTEGFNSVTVVVDSNNNVKVYVSSEWLNETLTGSVSEVKAQLLARLNELKASINKSQYDALYSKVEELLNSLTINSLEVNGKKLVEKDTYKVYVFGYKELYQLVEVEYTHEIADHIYAAVETVEPNCTEAGYTLYVCTVCENASYKDDFTNAHGHLYGKPVFNWNGTSCPSATFTCLYDINHTNTVAATVSEVVITEATYDKDGSFIYRASVEFEGTIYTEDYPEEFVIPALKHDYVAVVTPPTCTEGGYTTYTCTNCGDSYVADLVDPLGHHLDEVGIITKKPTCTETGEKVHKCADCDYIEVETLPALGHSWSEGVVTKSSTCVEEGILEFTCSVCGETKQESIDMIEHDYTDNYKIIAPTCIARGYTVYICNVCAHEEIDSNSYVDALGHDFSVNVDKLPTEDDEVGSYVHKCNRCGYETTSGFVIDPENLLKDEAASKAPTCTEDGYDVYHATVDGNVYTYIVVVHHLTHKYDEKITQAPTCTEAGLRTYTCSNCGDSYTEDIAALGHKYEAVVTPATCTKDGYTTYTCSACSDSYVANIVPALGHTSDEGTITTHPTCGTPGYKTYKCLTCGEVLKVETIDPTGKHTFDNGVVEKEATCVDKGVIKYTCSECGYSYTEEIPATGVHTYDQGIVTKEATCGENGVKTYTCSCGHSYTEEIPATGKHDYIGTVTKQPTVAEKGEMTYTCSVCGHSYKEEIPTAKDHSWDQGVVTKEATCGENGVKTYTCSICGETYEEEIPATGAHTYDQGVVTKEATCAEKGIKTYTCTVCGDSYTEEIPATGAHTYDQGVVTKQPSCVEEGVMTYTCTVCGYSYTEEIPATGAHTDKVVEVIAPTCTEDGKLVYACQTCGRKVVETDKNHLATGHSHEAKITKAPTCTESGVKTFTCHCGDTYTETIPATGHDYKSQIVAPTCTDKGYTIKTCSKCNDVIYTNYTDALGHKEKITITPASCTSTGLKKVTCTVCNKVVREEVIPPTGHNYEKTTVAPTCDDQGYDLNTCACGVWYKDNYVDALGHDYVELTSTAPTCTAKGVIVYYCKRDAEHTYEITIDALGHDIVETVIAPTCTENGYTLHKCSVCDYEFRTNSTPATGHSYGEWTYHKFPTDVEYGQMKQTCSVCGHINYKEVSPIGQIYNGVVNVVVGANGVGTILDEDMLAAIEASKFSGNTKITLFARNNVKVNNIELAHDYLAKLLEANLTLAIEMNNISVGLDSKAIEAIKDQSSSESPVSFANSEVGLNDLTDEQQKALRAENYVLVVRLEIASGDKLISDFRGGSASVAIPFSPQSGFEIENYKVVYVATDGKLEDVNTEYVGGKLVMNLSHFSEYSVINTVDTDFIFWMFIITIILLLIIIASLITLCVLISKKKDTHTVERIIEKVVEVPVASTAAPAAPAAAPAAPVEEDEEEAELEEDEEETLTEVQPNVMVAVESEEPEMVTSYIYSFRAKLIVSNEEVKDRYFGIIDAINSYKKVKISESFKRLRVYSGRTTYAQLVFVGKTLCLAMNLNYDDFKDKYHVLDVSDKKKFAETPVMIKLTSTRKVKQARELLEVLFEGFKRVEVESSKEKIPTLGLKALMNRGLVKSRLTKKRF